jgi:hypothetical protein
MVRILKSIPIVVMKLGVQASSQNRRSRHDLPTPARRRFGSEFRGSEKARRRWCRWRRGTKTITKKHSQCPAGLYAVWRDGVDDEPESPIRSICCVSEVTAKGQRSLRQPLGSPPHFLSPSTRARIAHSRCEWRPSQRAGGGGPRSQLMTRVKERVPLRAYRTIAELPACCASLLHLPVGGRVVGWFGRWGRGSATGLSRRVAIRSCCARSKSERLSVPKDCHNVLALAVAAAPRV